MKFRTAIDKAAAAIAKNKVIAAALVSLLAVAGAISQDDAATWTNIVSAGATLVSAVL